MAREYSQRIYVRLTDTDRKQIEAKMAELGIQNISAYIRKMALDGYCVRLETPELSEILRLLRICSNNLNQYARLANETGSIYAEDIQDLQERQQEIWEILKKTLGEMAALK